MFLVNLCLYLDTQCFISFNCNNKHMYAYVYACVAHIHIHQRCTHFWKFLKDVPYRERSKINLQGVQKQQSLISTIPMNMLLHELRSVHSLEELLMNLIFAWDNGWDQTGESEGNLTTHRTNTIIKVQLMPQSELACWSDISSWHFICFVRWGSGRRRGREGEQNSPVDISSE